MTVARREISKILEPAPVCLSPLAAKLFALRCVLVNQEDATPVAILIESSRLPMTLDSLVQVTPASL